MFPVLCQGIWFYCALLSNNSCKLRYERSSPLHLYTMSFRSSLSFFERAPIIARSIVIVKKNISSMISGTYHCYVRWKFWIARKCFVFSVCCDYGNVFCFVILSSELVYNDATKVFSKEIKKLNTEFVSLVIYLYKITDLHL